MPFVKKVLLGSIVLLISFAANAQNNIASPASTVVPRLVNFSGKAIEEGKPVTGMLGITFSIYNTQENGAPLWMETQNVQADPKGNYTVQLGATTSEGLPLSLFTSGEARWLGVRVNSNEEQPRILLLSVPYALKAADAQTLNGLPASAFVLAAPSASNSQSPASSAASSAANIGGSGTQDYIPLWTDSNGDLGNSILFQTGSGSTAKIGINETKPLFTLDVNGQELVRGLFEMATQNYASKTKGYNSQPLNFESSAFNSGTGAYTLNHFQWQAEPTGNDTTTPGATLNLLYGTDPAPPTETGLVLSSKGVFTFASGQTFPGTGTITGVTTASGSGLSGGGSTGNLNLSLVNNCAANQVLQWNGSAWACSSAGTGTITGVTAGTDLTGGGATGNVTLNIDTTKVPQLNAANTFTGNQTVNGNLSATGVVSAASYEIGSNSFAFGSFTTGNVFLGFAGNTTMTGTGNTATGQVALAFNTTGFANTADGLDALFSNTTGFSNTAIGYSTLANNTTGNYNTATGSEALSFNTTGSYNTANGYAALDVNTIGGANTASGYQALEYNTTGGANTASGYQALQNNTTGFENTASGFQALENNTTGNENTATGEGALLFNTTGSGNTANGIAALANNSTGGYNTASGFAALQVNLTGYQNVANGSGALGNNQDGSSNTADGANALFNNLTGISNTAVGEAALSNNTTGNYNTSLGFAAGSDPSTPNLTNSTAIGAFADVSQNNALVLGSTAALNGIANVFVGIDVGDPSNILTVLKGGGQAIADGWETYSSRRWKTNIKTLPDALSKVEQLRGVSYDLKDSGKHEIGVIAEEVGKIVPEIVTYEGNGNDARGVDYSRLTALLIEAVKQQQTQIALQQRQIHQLRQLAAAQRSGIARLNRKVGALESSLNATREPVVAALTSR